MSIMSSISAAADDLAMATIKYHFANKQHMEIGNADSLYDLNRAYDGLLLYQNGLNSLCESLVYDKSE